jgi:uncharacterized repeat protein (TIGR01451 family)
MSEGGSLKRIFTRVAGRLLLALAALCCSTAAVAVDVQVSGFTDNPDPAVRGGNISYTITVENSDADTAHNVVVTYPLPASSQFVSASDPAQPGACTFDGLSPGTVTCTYATLLGTLASPTAGPIETITVVVKTTGTSVTTLNSTVTVTTTDADTNLANNSLSQNTTINNGADLSAAMSGAPNPATGGANVTWTISGSNLGPNSSGAVTYTSTLPGVLTYVAAGSGGGGWTCGAAGQVVTCTLAAQAVGAYPNLPIVTKVTGVGSGTITLSGNITSTVGDPDLSNNSPVASVSVNPGTDLAVTQSAPTPSPAISGGSVTFALQPSNGGPYPASAGANVTFPLPAGFTVTSSTGSTGWACASAGSPAIVTCTFAGSLASGASGTLTIVATAPTVATPTVYSNITATIAPNSGGPADPNAANNAAARNLTVSPDGLDLSVTKNKTPAIVAVGANMTSTIVVANAGPRTAASGSITVVDALDPTKEQYVGFGGTNWSCVSAAPNVNCTYNAALAIASSSTLTITTQALAAGTVTNNATASYSGTPGDFNSANNTIGASVTATDVNNSPDLQVTLAATTAGGVQTTVEADETQITYTLALTNKVIATAVNAQNVVVTLSIPGRLTTTNVAVSQVLTNTSGTSTAAFTCTGTGTGSTGNVVCTQTGGTLLSPGDVMTFTAVANRPMLDVSNVNATASAVSTSQGDPLPGDNSTTVPITIIPIADVELVSKVLAANPVLAGTNATYTITLKNDGPSSAAGVSLADVFTIPGGDNGFTFVSATASNGGVCSGLVAGTSYSSGTPTETCSWGAVVANAAARTVTLIVRPNWQSGAGARTLANTATVSTTTAEDSVGGQGSFVDSKSLTLNINAAQVDVLINDSDLVDPIGYDPSVASNNDITYAVVETSNGPSLASGTGFTFTMTPPSGKTITFRGDGSSSGVAAANPSGTIPGSLCDSVGTSVTGPSTMTVTCLYTTPGQLANAASQTRYLVFRVGSAPSVGGDTYTTLATVVVNETDTNLSNNTEGETTTVRVRADISVTKTAATNPAQLRQPFNWTIVVTNGGPGDSQTTGLTDTLPAGMAFSGATPSWTSTSGGSGTCSVASLTLTCAFGLLPANQSATVTVPVKVTTYPAGGTTQNCATATTSEVDPNSANNLSVCGTVTVQISSLAGTVFQDRDRTGGNAGTPQSAATEPRISGVTVKLTGNDAYGNAVSLTTTTDVNGAYSFTNLSPADSTGYTITETQPGGFVNGPASPPAPAAGGTYAAGGSAGNSTYTAILLAGNTTGVSYDFPEVRKPSLSGFVYVDVNANNTRDAGTDTAISGATVRLLNAGTLAVIATTTTDGTGAYSFAGLDPLTVYTLEEPLPSTPAGLGNGAVNPGLINGAACASGCTAQANTPVANTDRIASIDLGAGTDGTVFNFGELQQTSLSGLVFIDANRNNLLDGSDTGRITGVTVRLVQGADCTSGTTLQTTSTAGDGTYSFASVLAFQNYLICETQPVGYGNGVELPGTNGAATPGSNVIAFTNLSASGSTGNNFGERVAAVSGSVYQDTGAGTPANFNNGLRDAGESGIVNVPVTLSGNDQFGTPVSLTINTDASGNYTFDGLFPPNGSGYTLTEGAIPPASGIFLQGKDAAGTAGGSIAVQDVTSGIALTAGQQAPGYLFGELPQAAVSGTVYIDRNRNNTIDATPTDGRIAGVTLRLVTGADCTSGTTLQTVTSANDGTYSFSNVAGGGNYLVCETQPSGYGNGVENPGTSATTPGANVIAIANLPSGGSSANNFGERVASVAGSVYQDYSAATPANTNNGVRDSGEVGIANVPVTLTGHDINGAAVNVTLSTDASGNYVFADLLQSDATGYTVSEGAIPPASGTFLQGKDAAGTSGGSIAVQDVTSGIVLGAGTAATGYLFGELPIAPISGTVYVDRNRNGTMDATPTDARIAGATLTLRSGATCAGTVLATTSSDASGNYSFSGIAAGSTVTICETQPVGYADGSVTPGTSAASGAANAITITNLPAAGSPGNLFGEQVGSLAGSVYLDYTAGTPANNNNGARDAGEPGIANVPVTLTGRDASGASVNLSTTTDGSGNYSFGDLLQSDATGYTVSEGTIPTASGSFLQGKDAAGTAGGSIAVQDVINGVALGAGMNATGYLFGELPNASIAGTVYLDLNRNGTMDASPTDGRIANVAVRLLQGASCASGTVLQTTTSAADGSYAFSGVAGGQNYLVCETQPVGYAQGTVNPGTSGTTPSTDTILITNLPSTGSSGNLFGERAGSVSGNVFLDANDDGLRTGDVGIAGVTVTLTGTDASGAAVSRTTTTDATGAYRFDAVLGAGAGGYTLTEQTAQPVVGFKTTLNGKTAAGTSGGTATAVAATPSAVASIVLAAGADASENNFAEILPVSIAGTVFADFNNNGVQNLPGDTGIAGVAIVVTGIDDTGAAVTRNVTTGTDGTYALLDLRPGTYTVSEPTQPVGTVNGQTIAGTAGGTATPSSVTPSAISGVVLTTPGTVASGYNFAEITNTSGLSGRVWLDSDNNGLVNGSEAGIAGVTINLTGIDLGGTAVSKTTTTDASGNYAFASLAPGTYTLTEPTQPTGTLNGTTVAGTSGGTASSVATLPSAVSNIVVPVSQISTGNNFGELPTGAISGRVFGDNNNNGTLDAGESGIANVSLVLTGTDDQGAAVNATTTSDANGAYSFANLRPGTYTVTEPTQPPGTVNGITTAGTVNGATSGTATSPATTPSAITGIVLPAGGASINDNFAEIGNSPDLLVSKASVQARFTVDNVGSYTIRVRNGGQVASSGAYTVSDRLPPGLTLAAVPTGTGWVCTGAVGASSFSCTASDVLAAGATSANTITASVNVAAAAAQSSPAINAVLVSGGGELPARGPSQADQDGFNNTPGNLALCDPGVIANACRTATPVQAAASISGTAWYDIGGVRNVLDGGDQRLAGWQVEVLDASGNIVARATTAADGTYKIGDLLPNVALHVRFRDPASNVVWGYPVNGEAAPGSSGAVCNTAHAIANGTASSCPGTGNDPTLTVVLAAGANLPQQSLPVDPSGVIYDSGTRQPVSGAVVTLAPSGACAGWDPASGLVGSPLGGDTVNGGAVSMTVGVSGFYQFLLAPAAPASCTFAITVAPPAGYTFTSVLIPPTAGPYVPAGAPGSSSAVQPQAGAPTGAVGPATTYYLTVTVGSGTANVINNHIPLDPAAAAGLSLSKTGDKTVAEIGDSVRYTLTVLRSSGAVPREVTIVDRLPAGFTFIAGTAVLNGVTVPDPAGKPGPALTFNLGTMPGTGQLVLQYRVRVGVGAQQGDGTNRAIGYGCGVPAGCTAGNGSSPLPGSTATNEARFKVNVGGGVFTTDACFAGKIFVDCNNNHIQDPEEIGIPGVRLLLSDGTTLVSDSEGKYSYCGLSPRSTVIRVDETTLPRGSHLTTSSNRNLGDAGSLWLDLKNGELDRADFIEGSCSADVLSQVKARRAQGEVRSVETEKKSLPALKFDSRDKGPRPRTEGAAP